MAGLLWQTGQQDAAIRLETLWNLVAKTHALSLLCGYAMDHVYEIAEIVDICAHHTHVVSANSCASAVRDKRLMIGGA
jgi:hypothetical protein